MTGQPMEALIRVIVLMVVFVIDIFAGYFMGHHFHSFVVGYVTYAVLAAFDVLSVKLSDIRDSLKGGR